MTQETEFNDFVELVVKNLKKNGFPAQKVGFPLERMYEEADRRGFSFNKVREVLRTRDIESELTDNRVVFSAADLPNDETQEMYKAAEEMLAKMSDEEKERLSKMMENITPEAMESMKKQWGSMSGEEKQRLMRQMKGS